MKIITKNAIKSRKKAVKSRKCLHFSQFIHIFLQFFDFNIFFVLPEIYRQAVKTINLRFFTPFFCNTPRFTPFFVSHRGKFTVAQGQFYDGKFFAVNSKKGVNRKTVGKVRCLVFRHLWQLKKAVFPHWCLICPLLFHCNLGMAK